MKHVSRTRALRSLGLAVAAALGLSACVYVPPPGPYAAAAPGPYAAAPGAYAAAPQPYYYGPGYYPGYYYPPVFGAVTVGGFYGHRWR